MRRSVARLLVAAGALMLGYVAFSRMGVSAEPLAASEWWSPTPRADESDYFKKLDEVIRIQAEVPGCSMEDAENAWRRRHTPAWAWGAKHTTVLGGVLLTLGLVLGVRVVTGNSERIGG